MIRMNTIAVVLAIVPGAAIAQDVPSPNTIRVIATGKASTPPDVATIDMTIRGEGRTPDAATKSLADRQKAIFGALQKLDPKLTVNTGSIGFREVRIGRCDANGGMLGLDLADAAERMEAMTDDLSTGANSGVPAQPKGPCRLSGHIAQSETEIVMASVKDAGTAVGLAGRLGAANARIGSFGLRDTAAAIRSASADAMRNARIRAELLATASGSRLGALISVMDNDVGGRDAFYRPLGIAPRIVMTSVQASPPVEVAVSPKPVETNAQLIVTFAIVK
ncbi:SIMPL domain-containing protein [Sphingomonas aliaeris]|uniref:SIMPL domain-containing protein n=1 Tax=Sphingomonas aliaeris TaxID=2759526 RepID=A0A974NXG8_9SPHN|nr:SIMPL domain-containing protein [Sphingomonas aliaeris]QQV78691.1 SIMPL domain-containing protein [Sphingomonas aliaeris]